MGTSSTKFECAGYAARTTLRGIAGLVLERYIMPEFSQCLRARGTDALSRKLKNVLLSLATGRGKFHE